MRPIEFPEKNVVYAENQPEYLPLPAHKTADGDVITCWELSEQEILEIATNGRLWLVVKTFNNPLQPIFLTTNKDEVINPENEQENPNETQTESQIKPNPFSEELNKAIFAISQKQFVNLPSIPKK